MNYLFLLFTSLLLLANTTLSKAEEEKYYQQLRDGLKRSESHIQSMQRNSSGGFGAAQMQLQSAQASQAIKETLLSNFQGTPAIQVPEIRERLLAIFNKDIITTDDLAGLKTAITNWQASMEKAPAQTPAPVPAY